MQYDDVFLISKENSWTLDIHYIRRTYKNQTKTKNNMFFNKAIAI
jgi:hypothetical protein